MPHPNRIPRSVRREQQTVLARMAQDRAYFTYEPNIQAASQQQPWRTNDALIAGTSFSSIALDEL
jgi:hypothetical protein